MGLLGRESKEEEEEFRDREERDIMETLGGRVQPASHRGSRKVGKTE